MSASTTQLTSTSSSVDQIAADRHCVFRCQQSWFALPATAVREVTYAPELSVVPGSHASLAGLCHLRSEFIPVMQIDALLDETVIGKGENQKLLVLTSNTGPWAILVSEVSALVALETLTNSDVNLDDPGSGVVLGTAMFRDHVVRVLDAHRLLQWSQSQLEQHWRALASDSPSASFNQPGIQ